MISTKECTQLLISAAILVILCLTTKVETAPTRCTTSTISMQGNTFEKSPSAPVGVSEQSGIEASGKFRGRARKADLESVVPFPGVLNFIEEVDTFYMTKVSHTIIFPFPLLSIFYSTYFYYPNLEIFPLSYPTGF